MPIPSEGSRVEYTGNGTATQFTIPFVFHEVADITVLLGGVPAPSLSYLVTGGNGGLGQVTFNTAPGSGVTITIQRDPPLKQLVNYANQGAYDPGVLTTQNDRLVTQIQRVSRGVADLGLQLNGGNFAPVNHTHPLADAEAGFVTGPERATISRIDNFRHVRLTSFAAGRSFVFPVNQALADGVMIVEAFVTSERLDLGSGALVTQWWRLTRGFRAESSTYTYLGSTVSSGGGIDSEVSANLLILAPFFGVQCVDNSISVQTCWTIWGCRFVGNGDVA